MSLHATTPPLCLRLPAACTTLPTGVWDFGCALALGFEVHSLLKEANASTTSAWLALQPGCARACLQLLLLGWVLALMKLVDPEAQTMCEGKMM